ncbi:zinc-binding dehydrogenase [Mycobacterium sp. CBMA293]|uniref:zinc-binding dehydrogenase n=1 Tax=unclassified Mycolicibacterium TaxID=2636767 RepID=UPI0012DE80C2|nr:MULTISPECIES: zinc-binding dehydrogenase [unclassified Mycolicibacterium]MUL50089.1 zinc-binding dehydrogenase [Mycolicibacterium sp. CBMA 360]MUL62550.1 zinc-binding dehydrogenase [Mycolicibacterium sp. CBMA 335]MUL69002.1 zinc-binding dehydrogenase [Mycolicibacterium sp. CBMA 311]MUL96941.1 zinc-binding dehydrogenase [Mycolicibacterium sp. CBMA 230]MUM04021.1 hypothetical protein [Mycolicibacterium sp. CBMA 213]
MWAQRLVAPGRFEQIDVPEPTEADLAPGSVLLKVLAGGICGSDLPYFKGQLPLPWGSAAAPNLAEKTPGFPMHEVVGEVVATNDESLGVGELVVGWASGSNAIAEYAVTAAAGVAPFDKKLDPGGAVTLQPLACVLDAVPRIGSFEGRTVAVLGIGPIGLLFGHVAKTLGAERVVGVDRVDRVDLGAKFFFDETFHASSDAWVAGLTDDERPDIVIEAVGHQTSTLGHALEAVGQEGLVYYFGIPDDINYSFPLQSLLRKNLRLAAGITLHKKDALRRANEYVSRFPDLANDYVTSRYAPKDVERAFEAAVTPSLGRAKIVLEMD